MHKDFEIITIPMFATEKIEATNIFNEVNIGDVFYYDQDSIFHKEIFDAGFLEKIPNEKCSFVSNEFNLNMGDKIYKFGEPVDLSNVQDIIIDRLVVSGCVKKIYHPNIKIETKKIVKVSKEKPKKVKKNSYAKIAKELNLTPKKFKTLYFEKFNKEIEDMKHTVSKPTEKKIIEALT